MSEMPEIPDDLKDRWHWRDQFLVLAHGARRNLGYQSMRARFRRPSVL
jgi:hypothetical protein